MDLKIKKRDFYNFVFTIVYKVVLDFLYVIFVYKLFAYSGFVLDFNYNKYLLSILYLILTYILLPKDNMKPSSIFLQMHFIIMIMPMLTLYSHTNESGRFMLYNIVFFNMQCILLRLIPNIKVVRIKNSKRILKWIIIPLSMFVYISMIRANGIPSLRALNFLNVYDIRSNVKYPFLMPYLVNWQAKIINPFSITISYIKKNKIMLFLSILMQILIYLIAAHKSYILIPIAIIVVIKILEKREFLSMGVVLAPVGLIFSYLIYKIIGSLTMPSLFIRRLLFVPAKLKFNYYDFFSKNKMLYFSGGIIGKIIGIKYPYEINAANLIGYLYGGSIETWANTGYLADAYANMGVFGMLIVSLLLVVIFLMINSFSTKISNEVLVGLSVFSILSLNDGALLTTLLTGGMLLLLVILYLYSNDFKANK